MSQEMRIAADLEGKRAIVTGGGTGIGLAIAKHLAAHGVRVAIADLSAEAAQQAAEGLGEGHHWLYTDVSKRKSVHDSFAEIQSIWGGYDILIANAGVSTMKRAIEITDDEWDFNFNVNTRGVFLTNQAAAQYFLSSGTKGVIVNTASLAAKVGAALLAHYSASKFAVLGWTQALARELAPQGIRVNAVCPGFVKTGMQSREIEWEAKLRGMTPQEVFDDYVSQTPLGRIESPDDVAGVVTFLCSDAARFMTGQGINVTGGVYMG